MEIYVWWLVIGFGLVIAELLTGTFYLLVLGVACFGASAAAWAGQGLEIQALAFTVVAAAGAFWVHNHRLSQKTQAMPSLDRGQPVTFESWIDERARLARVRYRGATWEAVVAGSEAVAGGEVFYIEASSGNRLTIARSV